MTHPEGPSRGKQRKRTPDVWAELDWAMLPFVLHVAVERGYKSPLTEKEINRAMKKKFGKYLPKK